MKRPGDDIGTIELTFDALPPELKARLLAEALESEYHVELRIECHISYSRLRNRWSQPFDLTQYRLVSRDWLALCKQCMRLLASVRLPVVLLCLRAMVSSVVIHTLPEKNTIVSQFYNIQCLDFSPGTAFGVPLCDTLCMSLHLLPCLTALRCGFDELRHRTIARPDFSRLTHLRSLSLCRDSLLRDGDLMPLAPHLQEFELVEHHKVSARLIAHMTALRSLALINVPSDAFNMRYQRALELLSPLTSLTSLTRLDMRVGPTQPPALRASVHPRFMCHTFLNGITHLTNLTDLTLDPRNCGRTVEEVEHFVAQRWPYIERLRVIESSEPGQFPRLSAVRPVYNM